MKLIGDAIQVLILGWLAWITAEESLRAWKDGWMDYRPVFGPKTFHYQRGRDSEYWLVLVLSFLGVCMCSALIVYIVAGYF